MEYVIGKRHPVSGTGGLYENPNKYPNIIYQYAPYKTIET